jgi:membrane-associated phospholipid phosphatase
MRPRLLPHEIVSAMFCIAGVVLLERMPVTYPRSALFLAYARPISAICVIALIVTAIRRRRDRAALRADAIEIIRGCVPLALVLATSFVLKSFIHLINSRVWDRQLFAIDSGLHFGYSPTIFLVTLLGNPFLLHFIDVVYSGVYYVIFFGGTALLLVFLPPGWRLRYAAAFVLMWMAGTVLYLGVPSWGPAFSATKLVEPALQSMPVTVNVQSQLYRELSSLVRAPLAPRVVIFGSVAAFPSLHLAVVTLYALAARRIGRRLFLASLLLGVVMLIGSVVSGYHFLIDGYAGALLAIGAWWLAGITIPLPTPTAPAAPPHRCP